MFDPGKPHKTDSMPFPRRSEGQKRVTLNRSRLWASLGHWVQEVGENVQLSARNGWALGLLLFRAVRAFIFSLAGRLFGIAAVFVIVAEIIIVIPSLANFQERWLIDSLRKAEIASLALDASTENTVTRDFSARLLKSAGAHYLAIQNNGVRSFVLRDPEVEVPEKVLDLRRPRKWIGDDLAYLYAPWQTFMGAPDRLIHYQSAPRVRTGQLIEIVVPAEPLKVEMKAYLGSMLRMSLSISFAVGVLVFGLLYFFILRPVRRMTYAIRDFRANPEDATLRPRISRRSDEIGHIERELATMQEEVRTALRSRARLAALGQAVSKINHDLRNMLTSAQLASDRMAASGDPHVAKALPRLERALDRALTLAQNVLTYGKSDERAPQIQIIRLPDLAEAAAEDAGLGLTVKSKEKVRFRLKAPKGFHFEADPDQMHRLLVNLMRNARQAIEQQPNRKKMGVVVLSAAKTAEHVVLTVSDNGPGIPEKLREKLFQPFASSSTPGGTGLGLAIARELAQMHGGDVKLNQSGPDGTVFEIRLPLKG